MSTNNTEAADILAAAASHMADPHQRFTVIPDGYKIEDLERYKDRPQRIQQLVTINNVSDFIEYVKRWQETGTVIWLYSHGSAAAHLDYHRPSETGGETGSDGLVFPSHVSHRCLFNPEKTEEFLSVRHADDLWFGQADFAEFLEDIAGVITTPDSATIIECARDISAKRNVEFQSRVEATSQDLRFVYSEETEARTSKGDIVVPQNIIFSVPIFRGQEPDHIKATFRYRIKDGNLTMGIRIPGVDAMVRAAIDKLHDPIRSAFPLVYGAQT